MYIVNVTHKGFNSFLTHKLHYDQRQSYSLARRSREQTYRELFGCNSRGYLCSHSTHLISNYTMQEQKVNNGTGTVKHLYHQDGNTISLIRLNNHGNVVWEVYCVEGNLFEGTKRFQKKSEAQKRIVEILNGDVNPREKELKNKLKRQWRELRETYALLQEQGYKNPELDQAINWDKYLPKEGVGKIIEEEL